MRACPSLRRNATIIIGDTIATAATLPAKSKPNAFTASSSKSTNSSRRFFAFQTLLLSPTAMMYGGNLPSFSFMYFKSKSFHETHAGCWKGDKEAYR
ncbi:MAG: hypothetical protein QXN01_04910 [Candidatus Anstonellales archaeon]